MKLIRIAKRGDNKVLSSEHWLSASFAPATRTVTSISIWFQEAGGDSRFRADMTRDEAEKLCEKLNYWLAHNESRL